MDHAVPRGKMVCQSNKAEFLKSREGKFQCCLLTQLVPRIFRKPLRMPRPMVPMLEVRFPCGYNSERSWWMSDPYHGWRKEFFASMAYTGFVGSFSGYHSYNWSSWKANWRPAHCPWNVSEICRVAEGSFVKHLRHSPWRHWESFIIQLSKCISHLRRSNSETSMISRKPLGFSDAWQKVEDDQIGHLFGEPKILCESIFCRFQDPISRSEVPDRIHIIHSAQHFGHSSLRREYRSHGWENVKDST